MRVEAVQGAALAPRLRFAGLRRHSAGLSLETLIIVCVGGLLRRKCTRPATGMGYPPKSKAPDGPCPVVVSDIALPEP